MKTLKLTRPVLEASLSLYSVIQKLNFVLPIFESIFPRTDAINRASTVDDLNQIIIFTAQYASFRRSNHFDPKLSTYVNLSPVGETCQCDATERATCRDTPMETATCRCAPTAIIQPVFYTIPLLIISHPKITRKMLIEFLPALSTVEKLNLILAIYDNICLNETDLNDLKKVMKGYVRYALKVREDRSNLKI